ncbi:MAG: GH2 [uncultured Thermomicrobiales bacterium]|uniref:GH2 n=1 Tax=uncultured Thermomicrobiales bacterium TaxID=1645740 RepID=A0A6J4V3K3_9BACT|nr:MAG: GH2 [uncultured Thermomicrobiales bacterium]
MPVALSPDHPRPQLQRAGWTSLDGEWEFAFDRESELSRPEDVRFDRTIRVPFAPEAPLSGIGDEEFTCAVWYRRGFEAPSLGEGERLVLRFGAVDYKATVWVDGCYAGDHEGGYTPFGCDVTDLLRPEGPHEVVVRAEDDPQDLTKPRGKQDWQRHPHSIWYPRTTGIWQTVWLEKLPRWWIDTLRWTASLQDYDLGLEAMIGGGRREGLRLEVRLTAGEGAARRTLANDTYEVVSAEVHRRLALSDPGIDDFRNELLWSPASPTLIGAELRLLDPDGRVIDEVASYTALRQVGVQGDRFVLNGRPLHLRLVLDQGYWPDGGLTAPSPDALRRDVELAKAMGFDGVRKHQKLEDPRYLYWADKLGLLVWQEMPSAYRFTRRSIGRLTAEWKDALLRDISHPCVVTLVPFNESWGVPDLPSNPAQRDYVSALYHLTKTIDPSRPVIGNDGWESVATDMVGIHDYDEHPDRLRERYGEVDAIPHLFRRNHPSGRLISLDGQEHSGKPLVLSEFGGITFTPRERRDDSWGYQRVETPEELAEAYAALVDAVRDSAMLAGFCYTQFADTYQEANGLLFADRTPKFPLERIERATRGEQSHIEWELDRRRQLDKVLDELVAIGEMVREGQV